MVLQWGMSDNFPLRALVSQEQLMAHSDELKGRIDTEIDALVGEAKLMAQEVLLDHREALERLTTVLIERETLERDEFELLMRGGELPELVLEADGKLHATQETTPVRLARLAAFTRPGIGHDGSSTEDAGWGVGDLDRRDPKSAGSKFRFGQVSITADDDADATDTDTTQEVA
jgi:hypothetical protein